MTYTSTVNYIPVDAEKLKDAMYFASFSDPDKIDSDSRMYKRAGEIFNQEEYLLPPTKPICLGEKHVENFELYILRLLIKEPNSCYVLPKILKPILHLIRETDSYQRKYFPLYDERFVYVTVRSGIVRSNNDDIFHADGFQSFSVPRHEPEQTYIWCDNYGAEFLYQSFDVRKLDSMKHNAHEYFNRKADLTKLFTLKPKHLYVFDPYQIHRRAFVPPGEKRMFVRINFSPVEIRDNSNTVNPNLIRGPYDHTDIRNKLIPFVEE